MRPSASRRIRPTAVGHPWRGGASAAEAEKVAPRGSEKRVPRPCPPIWSDLPDLSTLSSHNRPIAAPRRDLPEGLGLRFQEPITYRPHPLTNGLSRHRSRRSALR